MVKKTSSLIAALPLMILGVTFLVRPAAALDAVTAKAQAEIVKVLEHIEELNNRGEDLTKVSHMLYTDDVVVIGTHDTRAARGINEAIEGVDVWRKTLGTAPGPKMCHHVLKEPFIASATTFASFMIDHCPGNPPVVTKDYDARLLLVWKKLPQGWRIALEMWADGDPGNL
jgi:ketosteroid isomerase-like protein